jgi:hypothetical protein
MQNMEKCRTQRIYRGCFNISNLGYQSRGLMARGAMFHVKRRDFSFQKRMLVVVCKSMRRLYNQLI